MTLAAHPLIAELRGVVQRIALKSQIGAAVVGRSTPSTDEDIGGKRPSGGVSYRDDREALAQGYWMKSADYFQRQLERLLARERSTEDDLRSLLEEAKETLEAWEVAPIPKGQEPERGTFAWRCTIADDPRPIKEIQRVYTVSRSTVNRYRAAYRGIAKTMWASDRSSA